jgi:hypothetical protein
MKRQRINALLAARADLLKHETEMRLLGLNGFAHQARTLAGLMETYAGNLEHGISQEDRA